MPPVRFGLIACSSVARRRFLPALAETTRARLVRVGSRDATKAAAMAKEFGGAKHGSYEAVLADPEVDAVYISTPPTAHAEWVLKAAASRKHILCEKPAFPDLATARRALAECQRHGVRLLEGYSFRYHPQHAVVKYLVATGRIGTPRFFQAEFTYPRPGANDIRLVPALGGGVFHDSAGYPVAAALRQLPGNPTAVFCQLGLDAPTGVDNTFCAWLRFSDTITAQVLVAFDAAYRSRYAVVGTKGRIELERAFSVGPDQATTVVVETEAGTERIPVPPANQFRLMVEEFAEEIGRAQPEHPWERELLRQQTVMEAMALSQQERRVVDLEA